MTKIQLKRSNVLDTGKAKEPSASQMEYGELAINYNETDPAIFIKDSNNAIVRIAGADSFAYPGYPDLNPGETLDGRYVKLNNGGQNQRIAGAGSLLLQGNLNTEAGATIAGGCTALRYTTTSAANGGKVVGNPNPNSWTGEMEYRPGNGTNGNFLLVNPKLNIENNAQAINVGCQPGSTVGGVAYGVRVDQFQGTITGGNIGFFSGVEKEPNAQNYAIYVGASDKGGGGNTPAPSYFGGDVQIFTGKYLLCNDIAPFNGS